MGEAPDKRMFIGQSVESVDRGVVSTGQLFVARRPDSPYLVPGVDIEFVRADIANGYREALHKARTFMMRQSNDAHERGTAWQLAPEGNTVANEIEEALAKGDEG